MLIRIDKKRLSGTAAFPPSKSDSHRLLISAALAEGESIIRGISKCDDVMATIESLRALGTDISISGDTATVKGIDIRKAYADRPLYVNESGSTLRFLIPIALLMGKETRFTGKERLFERPLGIYRDITLGIGGRFDLEKNGLTVSGKLSGGEYRVKGDVSSQFITGLLFALPLLENDSRIVIEPPFESRPYVDMTVDTLRKFGVKVEFEDENTILISGRQKYIPHDDTVDGDWSAGAFLIALGHLHPDVKVSGYNRDTLQGDSKCVEYLDMLKGGYSRIDISDCPDLGPILFAMAAYFGGAEFTGTRRLLIKESDRCGAMAEELEKFGAEVDISENSVTVRGGDLHKPNCMINGHNDHRIVMSMAVLCSIFGGEIDGAEAVKKSYPEFFEVMKNLGRRIDNLEQI